MIKKRRKQLIKLYVFFDIISIILSFFLTYFIRFDTSLIPAPRGIPHLKDYLLVLPILIFIQIFYFAYQEFYKIKLRRNRLDDLFSVILNTIISSFLVIILFSYLRSYRFVDFEISHLFMVVYIPISVFVIFTVRMLVFKFFRKFFLKNNGISKILIAGYNELGRLTAENLAKYEHFGIEIAGYLYDKTNEKSVLGSYDDLEKIIKKHGITDLFIALSLKEYDSIMKMIEVANNNLIDVRIVPDIIQLSSIGAAVEHIEGVPVINLGETPLQGWRAFLKRVFDFVFSLIGLIILSPFLLLIAIIIKIDSKGPVFYIQKRVGLDGKTFNIIKFRTMVKDAEKNTGAVWSKPGDKRITKFGRFLRKFSIDELPQLFNVLKGDMSLVGPRPERPEFVEEFKNNIPKYMLRHRVKTGITGWAQVHGLRGNTSLEKRIEFDIYYIQNWSFRLDLEILWRTILKLKFIDTNN